MHQHRAEHLVVVGRGAVAMMLLAHCAQCTVFEEK
jgi:hypothetical protein